MDLIEIFQKLLLFFPVFIFSLSVHEAAHAITAKWGGDLTSAYQGRITLNPIPHIDPVGTLLIPLLMTIFGGLPLIGWAKPVPVVETNYRRGRKYGVIVALAGPFSNILIALFTVAVAQVLLLVFAVCAQNGIQISDKLFSVVQNYIFYCIAINLLLAVFNMTPLPPLDGSHLLWYWFVEDRPALHAAFFWVRQYSYIILVGLVYFGGFGLMFTHTVQPLTEQAVRLVVWPTTLIWNL